MRPARFQLERDRGVRIEMKIAIGEFAHETNTFRAGTTPVEAFKRRHWLSGDEIISGHRGVRDSLGGMLAPRIAALDGKTAGLVVMAGNTRPPEELVVEQADHLVSVGAVTAEQAAAVKADAARLRALKPGAPESRAATLLGAPASYWLALRGIDPPGEAKTLGLPVLVLQGGRDYQVTSKDLDGWRAALGKEPRATIRLFPSLNHLFVAGEGPSTPAEYERPGHVAPEAVEAIASFLLALPPRAAP